jgi:preprotein translocase subunit SecA
LEPEAVEAAQQRSAAPTVAPKQETVVKSDWDKTPRNAPCPCGSGKKYKQCHGAA